MRISIIGTGYVGLVTGICLAKIGHDIICMDSNKEKIKKLKQNATIIYKKNIDFLIKEVNIKNKINFTSQYKKTVLYSDVIFIAFGTPSINNSNETDLEFSTIHIPEFLQEGKVIENFFNPDIIIVRLQEKRIRN